MNYKEKKSRKLKYGIAAVVLTGIKIIDSLSLVSSKSDIRKSGSKISTPSTHIIREKEAENGKRTFLKVMTLNVAHGRKDGRHQLFRKKDTIKANLNDISAVLRRMSPDLVALQEADGPSVWSGNFDHVRYIARNAGYAYSVRGDHVKGKTNSYGTALMSHLCMNGSLSIQFAPSPPTFSKGVVISTVKVPGDPDIEVDVVSVHLDFSRKSVRGKQVQEIINALSHRKRPLIMMGDFNCEWAAKEPTLRILAEEFNLKAYRPEAFDMKTYPKSKKRLDWILISPEFEFITYNVVQDTISDHCGVIADLKIVNHRSDFRASLSV
ncbi:MAG: endonuclease/exonuclease/phosphatase family protein [Deltaproteobacteria bacterium]|nr:endonuclease/exonuclease/phosphatase family protein [Deltaproteobacteria bacterium]